MNYQVGDQVVHWTYGLGEIVQLEEKKLLGRTTEYYVVQIRDLKIWVPVGEPGECSLRYLTPASEFQKLFAILSGPAQQLPEDRLIRKAQLTDQLKDGKLDSVCQAVRDLAYLSRTKKMNDNDKALMERAQNFLLTEWAISLSISMAQAKLDLNHLLSKDS